MITVWIDYHHGVRSRLAIEPHVNDPYRNVLPRKLQLYHAAYRPANYPVPATITVCAIHPYVVQIAEAIWFESGWEFKLLAEYDREI